MSLSVYAGITPCYLIVVAQSGSVIRASSFLPTKFTTVFLLYMREMFGNEHSMERHVVQGQLESQQSCGRSPSRWTGLIKGATQTFIVQS